MSTTAFTRRTARATIAGLAATAALAALPALAIAAPAVAAESSPAELEQSIVYVKTTFTGYVEYPTADGPQWSDGYTLTASCTGFFVSTEGHIATAGHCVDDEGVREDIIEAFLEDNGVEDLYSEAIASWRVEGYETGADIDRTVEVVQPDSVDPVIGEWMTAQVVDHQEFDAGDAALLKVAALDAETPALDIADATPEIGADVTSIGFPGSVQDVVDTSRLSASFKTGTVSSQQITEQGIATTEINAQVSSGMSGGPTVDSSGHVLGINSFGIDGESQSFNFITDTDGLASFLRANDVPFEQAAPVADAGRSDAADGEDAAPIATSGSEARSDSGTDAGSPFALVGVIIGTLLMIGLVVTVAVVALVVILRRRSARLTAPVAPVVAPAAPAAPQPTSVAWPMPQAPATAAAPVGFAAPLVQLQPPAAPQHPIG